ncbi:hypothetical protein LTR09_006574 [Extremus antarcticus]|uniref:Uncharacterized protein n=1 Tax=Extremus antarcticus TaxID=702011 RepID=A0AAJ0DL68_9PEZI|nr:hypothetical protein LTR09_006574 [Extremus antarcticus]
MPEHAASFALVRATAHDIPEIVDLMYDAFEDFVRRVVMGCYSQDDMPKLVAQYIGEMQNDPSDIWIKVSDVNTGKIVAASNWKLCATASTPRGVDEVKPWIQDEEAIELSRTVLEPLNELRLKANAEQDSYRFDFFDYDEIVHNGEVKGTAMRRESKPYQIGGAKS